MKLDLQNYESVFFNLLEGNYSEVEEERLFKEIENDPFLRFEWENWQKTKLVDQSDQYAQKYGVFFDTIKEESDVVVMPKRMDSKKVWRLIPLMTTLAASIVIFFFVVRNNQNQTIESNPIVVNETLNEVSEDASVIEQDEVNEIEVNVAAPSTISVEDPQDNLGVKDVKPKVAFVALANEEVRPKQLSQRLTDTTQRIQSLPLVKVYGLVNVGELTQDVVLEKTPAKPKYKRTFTVTTEDLKRKEVVLTRNEIENTSWRKLLEDKTIRLVWIGNKTYLRLESFDSEPVLIGLQE